MPTTAAIHVFEDGVEWYVCVVADGAAPLGTEVHPDRGEARARARTLARDHAPSRIVAQPPAGWVRPSPQAAAPEPAAEAPSPTPTPAPPDDGDVDPSDPFLRLATTRPAPGAATTASADDRYFEHLGFDGSDDDGYDRADEGGYEGAYDGPDEWSGDEPRSADRASGPGGPRRGSGGGDGASAGAARSGGRGDGTARRSDSNQPARRPPAPTGPAPTVYRRATATRPDAPAPTDARWRQLAGPDVLGRSVLLDPGAPVPEPWADARRVELGAIDLAATERAAALLVEVRTAFLRRERLVVVVDRGFDPPAPGVLAGEPWSVPVDVDLVADAVWALATANAVDARGAGGPTFLPAHGAVALGATAVDPANGTEGDVVLPDGPPAWCDGGPLRLWRSGEVPGDVAVVPRLVLEHDRLTPLTTDAPEAALAPDQLDAVAEPGMRARIIAPAGSGKTRVLTERARHLLRAGVPQEALCLVAFNRRAQQEMQDRTPDLPGLRVQTLNALALAIVNGTGAFRSRGSTRRTIDEIDVRRLLGEMVTFPRRANTDPAAAWIDALSAVRLGLQEPAEVEADYNGDVDGFAELFPRYRAALRERGVLDFDEQIYAALEALLTEPDTRADAQRQARVLLVDEYQDLTPAHMLLLRLLAGPELAIFGVGDDDQTIYGYSGATPAWLVGFDRYVPEPAEHALEVNYRCPAPVVEAASNLLSRNRFRVAKSIVTGPANDRSAAALTRVVDDDEPVAATVALVRAHLDAGARPDEVAVLTRVNTLLAPVQVALADAGIPVNNRDGARFVERTGVAAALAWLRLAIRPDKLNAEDVRNAARRPPRGLSPRVVEWMGEQRQVAGLERLAGRMNTERDAEKVRAFGADIERLAAKAPRATTAELLESVRTDLGLDRAMQTLDQAHRGRNSAAHSDDLRALIALGRLHPTPTTFFKWLKDLLDVPGAFDGVQLATVHRVKGLEWPHVIVHDATNGVFPHRLSTDVEEERRVFHVAITRSQRTLHLVADPADPSLFLGELDSEAPPAPAASPDAGVAAPKAGRGPATIEAEVGLAFTWGGYEATVTEVRDDGVTIKAGGAPITVPFGSEVSLAGKPRALIAPVVRRSKGSRGDGPGLAAGDQGMFDALKAWRAERSRADAVPAFVVASDRTLEEIAAQRPTSIPRLLQVNGIGPAKADRYGAEIIAVVEATGSGSPDADAD